MKAKGYVKSERSFFSYPLIIFIKSSFSDMFVLLKKGVSENEREYRYSIGEARRIQRSGKSCKELIPGYLDGVTGEYATPEGYLVDEEEAEKFDHQFPYKEKRKLPGQIF